MKVSTLFRPMQTQAHLRLQQAVWKCEQDLVLLAFLFHCFLQVTASLMAYLADC